MDDCVVIVGAGPTGLVLALKLGMAGISCLVLEAEPTLAHDLRAGSFHPPTIEMLAELGIADAMHQHGIRVPTWQIRHRIEGLVAEFDLTLIADETPLLHLEQHRLTPLLLEAIAQRAPKVHVRFSSPVSSLNQDDDGVTVKTRDGREYRASFAVGCDGARSLTRSVLGIEFEGFTWPERFLVASTSYDLARNGLSGASYIADPDHWAAIIHVPDEGPPGLWRLAYGIPPQLTEQEALDPTSIEAKLRIILEHSKPDVDHFPLKYASIYRVHQRVAKSFDKGRVVLAGDAAHLNNPLGGFGLNGSIHDAMNLGDKLIDIFGGADDQGLFALYTRQRRLANIEANQTISIRNKKLLAERTQAERDAALNEIRHIAGDLQKARAFLLNSSMINAVRAERAAGTLGSRIAKETI